MLKELLDNSLDACESAHIPPVIAVYLQDDALTVTDNGSGLPLDVFAVRQPGTDKVFISVMLLGQVTRRGSMKRMALVIALVLAGCAAPNHSSKAVNTPSGRPEVTFTGVTKKQIADKLVATRTAVAPGIKVKVANEYSLVFENSSNTAPGVASILGPQLVEPAGRVTYSMLDVEGGIKVIATIEVISSPGTAIESTQDVTAIAGYKAQAELEAIKAQFLSEAEKVSNTHSQKIPKDNKKPQKAKKAQ